VVAGCRALTGVLLAGLVLATTACVPELPQSAPPTRTTTLTVDPPPTRTPTPRPTPSRSALPTSPTTPTTPTVSVTTVPLEDLDPCPTAEDLAPSFTATKIGTHPDSGNSLVEVRVAYTNPLPDPMWLMGSLGYLDPAGNDQFLYHTPGGLPFEDKQLAPGPGELVVELEDVVGAATESEIYLSYWALASTPAGSADPPTCRPTRGIFEPPPIPEGAEGD